MCRQELGEYKANNMWERGDQLKVDIGAGSQGCLGRHPITSTRGSPENSRSARSYSVEVQLRDLIYQSLPGSQTAARTWSRGSPLSPFIGDTEPRDVAKMWRDRTNLYALESEQSYMGSADRATKPATSPTDNPMLITQPKNDVLQVLPPTVSLAMAGNWKNGGVSCPLAHSTTGMLLSRWTYYHLDGSTCRTR